MRYRWVLTGLSALVATGCNSPAPTNQNDNATVNAAEAAAREMHNQMSANETADDGHSGMQGMNGRDGMGMGNMPADSMGNMQGNSTNSAMPMEDDSGHM